MKKYTVFFGQTATGYSAHVPDLPGCVAAGVTLEETRQLIREAIEFHLEGMRLHGEAILTPQRMLNRLRFRRDEAIQVAGRTRVAAARAVVIVETDWQARREI